MRPVVPEPISELDIGILGNLNPNFIGLFINREVAVKRVTLSVLHNPLELKDSHKDRELHQAFVSGTEAPDFLGAIIMAGKFDYITVGRKLRPSECKGGLHLMRDVGHRRDAVTREGLDENALAAFRIPLEFETGVMGPTWTVTELGRVLHAK